MLIYLSDQDYRAKWSDQSDKIYPLRYRTCVRPFSYSIDSSSFSRPVPERRGWDACDSVEPESKIMKTCRQCLLMAENWLQIVQTNESSGEREAELCYVCFRST